ncbi:two-component response regulator [Sandaracinus amylolyticus]|uniref:Two-component response regulator n=1 Tax=Sandaracinus amylolyticus TaxID=927083 RepID=A0A0F6YKZ3_9BACT|nr:two-component response regulator [Sandaracinus amylolyticus]
MRRVVERTLVQAGFEVVLAADGREGLERASAMVPDLVLVDFVMPHMNGFQLCQALRGIDNLARVPVVLMSAKADRIGDGFLAQTGALDAITKPFSPEALLAVTTHAMARAAAQSSPPPPLADDSGERSTLSREARAIDDDERDAEAAREAEDRRRELDAQARRVAARVAELAIDAITASPASEPLAQEALAARIEATASPEALLGFAGEIAEMVPALRGEVGLEGRIEHVPLGEVLQMLQHLRQTGVLEVRRSGADEARTISVCMSHGTIDLALGRDQDQEFLLGRYLLEEELLDRDDLERLLSARAPGPRTLLGTRLVKLGYLSHEELQRALVRQTSELVYESLRWKKGSYRFVRFATRPEALEARLGLPIGAILMEGLRRVDEWRLIEEQIRSWDDVLRPDRDAIAAIDLDRLAPEERSVLDAIDGEKSVRAIASQLGMGSFELGKILFQLLTARLVRAA